MQRYAQSYVTLSFLNCSESQGFLIETLCMRQVACAGRPTHAAAEELGVACKPFMDVVSETPHAQCLLGPVQLSHYGHVCQHSLCCCNMVCAVAAQCSVLTHPQTSHMIETHCRSAQSLGGLCNQRQPAFGTVRNDDHTTRNTGHSMKIPGAAGSGSLPAAPNSVLLSPAV